MRVAAEDHSSHSGHAFAVVAVNDGHARRNIDAAVLVRCGERKLMVVLVDRSAYRTQGIVAVGQNIRHRKLFHAGSTGGLNDADIGNIVTGQRIIRDMQYIRIAVIVMRIQDAVCHRSFSALFGSAVSR